MAHLEQVVVGGALTTVEKLDHSAQQVDDAIDNSLHGFGKNLLDNWYFADPINQRGATEYIMGASYTYTVDRWKGVNATVSLLDGYIKFATTKTGTYKRIMQVIEAPLQKGQTCTISMLANINNISGTVVFRPCSSAGSAISNATGFYFTCITDGFEVLSYTFTLPSDMSVIGVEILCSNVSASYIDMDICALKFELGSVQTLAHKEGDTWVLNDPPPNKALELAKCQRYFERVHIAPGDRLVAVWTNNLLARYSYKVAKRATPTIVGHPLYICRQGYNDGVFGSQVYKTPAFRVGVDACSMYFLDTQVAAVDTGHYAYIGNTTDLYFDVSADL